MLDERLEARDERKNVVAGVAMQSVFLFVVIFFSACTDYVSQIEDRYGERKTSSDILLSSSWSSEGTIESCSSATKPSSSSAAKLSSSQKTISSSSEKNGSSSAALPPSSSSAVTVSSSATAPASSAAASGFFSGTWREDCLAKINEYRATENLDPLTLAPEEKQVCTDKEAADDLAENKAHGHFGNCGEGAQNSGPNFNTSWRKTATEATDAYLKMMWEDEKALVTSGERDPDKKEDYSYIGHYLNMKGNYKTVACGIALSKDGKKGWLNINFFRK